MKLKSETRVVVRYSDTVEYHLATCSVEGSKHVLNLIIFNREI